MGKSGDESDDRIEAFERHTKEEQSGELRVDGQLSDISAQIRQLLARIVPRMQRRQRAQRLQCLRLDRCTFNSTIYSIYFYGKKAIYNKPEATRDCP